MGFQEAYQSIEELQDTIITEDGKPESGEFLETSISTSELTVRKKN